MIIAFLGPKNSGKSTAAKYINQRYGFSYKAFADPIKDICCVLFGWDRAMMEGITPESREWREQIDHKWAGILGIPDFSPRKAMTIVGTDTIRTHLHEDVFVHASLNNINDSDYVFGDCRHINETKEIIAKGGTVVRIENGPLPEWTDIAISASEGYLEAIVYMKEIGVHPTEYEWLSAPYTHLISNDGSLEELEAKIDAIYQETIR